MKPLLRGLLAIVAGFFVINVIITLWAFVAVVTLWPELAPAADGAQVFPPSTHPAFKVEMAVNLPVAFLAAYVRARVAGRREVLHVSVLGGLLLSLSAAYALGAAGAEFGTAKPMWAQIGTAAGLIVGLSGGAWFWLRQKTSFDA